MASKYLQKFPVPPGFQQILTDFTREVLRDQPQSIAEYAAKYFEMMQKGQKFEFDSKYNVKKQDKKYQLSHNPKKAEQITKKAAGISASIASSSYAEPQARPKQQSYQNIQQPQIAQAKQQSHERPEQSDQQNNQQQQNQLLVEKALEEVKEKVPQKQVANFLDQLSKHIKTKAKSQGQTRTVKIKSIVDNVFPDFDKDESGFLEGNQLALFAKAVLTSLTLSADVQVDQEMVQNFKKMCDENNDGKISRKQLQIFLRWYMGDLI